jgi:hypothetical protein
MKVTSLSEVPISLKPGCQLSLGGPKPELGILLISDSGLGISEGYGKGLTYFVKLRSSLTKLWSCG